MSVDLEHTMDEVVVTATKIATVEIKLVNAEKSGDDTKVAKYEKKLMGLQVKLVEDKIAATRIMQSEADISQNVAKISRYDKTMKALKAQLALLRADTDGEEEDDIVTQATANMDLNQEQKPMRHQKVDGELTFQVAVNERTFSDWVEISSLHLPLGPRDRRGGTWWSLQDEHVNNLPGCPGVYELRISTGGGQPCVAYVGKAKNLKQRLNQHANGYATLSAVDWVVDSWKALKDRRATIVKLECRYIAYQKLHDAEFSEAILLYKYDYLLNAQNNDGKKHYRKCFSELGLV